MIELYNICKTFGALQALDNLSLTIRPGELFCFLGSNGAGKTTTIKILTGLLRASSGRALVNGMDIQHDPIAVKRQIGYIPDTPYLYERLTVTEFFRFYGELFDIPEPRIDEEMERNFARFGLLEHRGALVKELSHGLRQRLIYATTFLHNPKIMLIDEPFVGLDPYTIRLIKDLLRAHTRAGGTILLTTHILAIAEDIADRVGIIHRGRLVALGTLADLRREHDGASLEDLFLKLTRPGGA
jgi:ABC-2 type transport system ATP-binding protein